MTRALCITLAAILTLGAAASCAGDDETTAGNAGGTPAVGDGTAATTEGAARGIDVTLTTRLAEADQAFRNNQYDTAGEMYEAVAGQALEDEDASTFAEAAAMRARCYLSQGEEADGLPWLLRAEEQADPEEPLGWSRYLGARGRFEWQDGDSVKATETFHEMFNYCESHELYDRAVDAAHMIAITGDPEERFQWAETAIEMAEKSGMQGWLAPLWNNLGWDYVDAGRYDEARAALEKAREYHYMGTAPIPKLIADYSVAHVMRLQGQLYEAQKAMNAVLLRAEELDGEGNRDAIEWIGFSRWELGEIEVAGNRREAGISMMRQALGELERAGIEKWDNADWMDRKERLSELEAE